MIIQERRIGELERKCKISNDGLSGEYTNKPTDAENLENYHDEKRVDSKKSTLPGQVLKLAQSRRAIDSGKEHFLFKKKINAIANLSNLMIILFFSFLRTEF